MRGDDSATIPSKAGGGVAGEVRRSICMRLTIKQSRRVLWDYSLYVTEACDRCGQILGWVRYTRSGESGTWCSRKCRDGHEASGPGTCHACGASLVGLRRGTRFCSTTCRTREHKQARTGKISRSRLLKRNDLQARVEVSPVLTHRA